MARPARIIAPWTVIVPLAVAVALIGSWAKPYVTKERTDQVVHMVKPSDADPAIKDFNHPAYVTFNKGVSDKAQLVLFFAGTRGTPHDRPMLRMVADQGYRTIDLAYNDDPAVNPMCPRRGDADCSDHFRGDRLFGDAKSQFTQTPAAETIVNRLTKTLQYLAKQYPDEHWGDYLADGKPNWSRIVVSGLSQGAGMAAYIAKHYEVARVVLFSSPADFVMDDNAPLGSHPAPWLSMPSATPMDRWFAEYHARERGAERLKESYAALKIPPDHINVFNLDLDGGDSEGGGGGGGGRNGNPFHGSTIKVQGYAPQWKAMYGTSPR